MRAHNPISPVSGADPSWRIGIVTSSYYKEEVQTMVRAAQELLIKSGIAMISVHEAPGCFEIPLIGAALAEKKAVDGLIALGIIVEGETHHARLLVEQSARGIMDVQLRYNIPFAFEVLYVDDLAHARARGEKGAEAAQAVLKALSLFRTI